MKVKAVILCCVVFTIVFLTGYRLSRAASGPEQPGLRIGVVSIRKVFRDSARSARYRQQATVERSRTEGRLTELGKEIEAQESGLKVLKPGSGDYLTQLKQILQKRAELETEKDFYSKRMSLKEQTVTESLYRDILQATREAAQRNGLQLVFEKSEPELPASSPTQLELAMGTHKVLYSDGCVDITEEVMVRVDAMDSEQTDVGASVQ
jgi:Skp family chaperone for outer membrane proteins